MEEIFPLITFLKEYSLSAIIIAVVTAIVKIVCDRYLAQKLPRIVLTLIPFTLAVTGAVVVDMAIYCKAFTLRVDAVYNGLLSGSIGIAFSSAFTRVKNGQSVNVSTLDLVIEGILEGYVKSDAKTIVVSAVVTILNETANAVVEKDGYDKLTKDVVAVIKEYSLDGFDENELTAVSVLIIKAFNSIKKENTKK